MSQNDDQKATNQRKNKPEFSSASCPICNGIGFYNGKICVCIAGTGVGDVPEFLMGLFGMKK